MTQSNKKIGIYIHIPFCIRKCNYCDFCSYPATDEAKRGAYVAALCRQIRGAEDKLRGYTVDTVYFGGGTPTLLTDIQFEHIFRVLREVADIEPDAEITVECNPKTADTALFRALRALGVNRLSLGMQSAHDEELKILGRAHSSADFVEAFSDARNAGFDNINADIMFGIPGQTRESFASTLATLTALRPEHISAYSLILEPGTPFFANRENLVLPDEDTEYTMYADAISYLSERGYSRYEISNFSLEGRESRHNLRYWLRDEYLGFGAAAHSFYGNERSFAPSELDEYIGGNYLAGCETVSENDAMCEYVMLRMRLVRGVEENVFAERFGRDFWDVFGDRLKKYCDGGFVVREDGRCAFTDNGFCVSNTVLSDILSFDA